MQPAGRRPDNRPVQDWLEITKRMMGFYWLALVETQAVLALRWAGGGQ